MFHKAFRIKSNTNLKSSSRKKLQSDISDKYPHLSPEDLESLTSSKEDMTVMKIQTHSGNVVTVYCYKKNPMFFEADDVMYPTVYALWKVPHLIPSFTTWAPVLKRLCGGADLMLPGVITPDGTNTINSYGKLQKGAPCFVNLSDNGAAVAVGKTALSSFDMYMSAKQGKCVYVLHTYRDFLWTHGDQTELPEFPPPAHLLAYLENEATETGDLADGASETVEENNEFNEQDTNEKDEEIMAEEVSNINLGQDDELAEKLEDVKNSAAASQFSSMDELSKYCFFKALKTSAKKIELPALSSAFYRVHMLRCCPADECLDIKKSSYKKLSKFLKEMQKSGYVEVKELTKGVESITAVNFAHPDVKTFHILPGDSLEIKPLETAAVEDTKTYRYVLPEIEELFLVSAEVLPLFRLFGLGKGAALTGSDVRKLITDYVKQNNLNERSNIKLDAPLTAVSLAKNEDMSVLSWDQLLKRVLNKMKPGYKITFSGKEPVIKKGKAEPIDISIAQRTGNKQVTLVSNLETYGLDPQQFAHTLQIGVAASTSVNPTPNKKDGGMQVLVQGNQVKFLSKLLLDEYKIPRKFIKGLELAAKKGKK